MLRFGLLGAGRIGKIHGGNIANSERARLVAVADADPTAAKALAKSTGAESGFASGQRVSHVVAMGMGLRLFWRRKFQASNPLSSAMAMRKERDLSRSRAKRERLIG